jgi:large subunit ribosomal protein L3
MLALIGRKVGMTQIFSENGEFLAVSLVRVPPNVVVGVRTVKRDGYEATVLGAEALKEKRTTKPYAGQFKQTGQPTRLVMEIRDWDGDAEVGAELGVELLAETDFVDVTGTSKGKGFQGVMKRHGFGGGRKTHGSKFHRGPGSTGQSAWPGKVIKGKKMPGRMGGERSTMQNLPVLGFDASKQLLILGGAIPGPRDGVVLVAKAKKNGGGRSARKISVTRAAGANAE